MFDGPRLISLKVIAYSYTIGRGTEDDPIRTVRALGTTDGHLIARMVNGSPDENAVGTGFGDVYTYPIGGEEA